MVLPRMKHSGIFQNLSPSWHKREHNNSSQYQLHIGERLHFVKHLKNQVQCIKVNDHQVFQAHATLSVVLNFNTQPPKFCPLSYLGDASFHIRSISTPVNHEVFKFLSGVLTIELWSQFSTKMALPGNAVYTMVHSKTVYASTTLYATSRCALHQVRLSSAFIKSAAKPYTCSACPVWVCLSQSHCTWY